jgi:hypothetical protein
MTISVNPAWCQLQRRVKAQKSSACGLCKPWKKGGEDKKTVDQLRKAQDADQQLKEVSLRPSSQGGFKNLQNRSRRR